MTTEQLRAVVATRISKLTTATTSPESQVTNARAYAEAHGWKVVGEASDLDVSASSVGPWERPELGAWLRRPQDFDVLVFRSIDRLARKATDFSRILEWAQDNDVRLVSLSPSIDYSTTVGRLIASVLANVAEMEADAIRERVRGARSYMRQIARWPSGMPAYGYRTCPHPSGSGYALEPDPETSPVLLELVQRVLDGEAVNAVVKDFNARGIKTPQARARDSSIDHSERLWQTTNAMRLLRSEGMLGTVRHKGVPVLGADGQPVQYGPPLVDRETWRDLQAELAKRRDPNQTQKRRKALLVDVAFCGHCGGKLYITGTDNRGGRSRKRYGCISKRFGKDCPGPALYADLIEPWVEKKFLKAVGRMMLVERVESAGEDHRAEIADIRAQLTRLREHGRMGLYDDAPEEFATAIGALQKRLKELEGRPSETTVEEQVTGETYAARWAVDGTEGRRAALLSAGVRVELAPGRKGIKAWEERLTFEMRGPEDLLATGTDDPLLFD